MNTCDVCSWGPVTTCLFIVTFLGDIWLWVGQYAVVGRRTNQSWSFQDTEKALSYCSNHSVWTSKWNSYNCWYGQVLNSLIFISRKFKPTKHKLLQYLAPVIIKSPCIFLGDMNAFYIIPGTNSKCTSISSTQLISMTAMQRVFLITVTVSLSLWGVQNFIFW